MKLVSVIRSYVGRVLIFGNITIKPWNFVEVSHEDMQSLAEDVRLSLQRAVKAREVVIQMVANDKPVDAVNESLVLQMKAEADKGSKS